ncbi:Z1 domain-containing protein [Mesorhizobium sp. KR9-304]|uniref:Z1 domain-containing protein n=1 Tax=Mesorhizobium sp. KR9-304 TaxID=3156614 RepID=UPI0032B5D961
MEQITALLTKQIGNENEVKDIVKTAKEVSEKWVNPTSGGKQETNGLVYGLVQSGKTGVLTVTGAMGADEGYRTLIVLTSDNDALYEQTLGRIREAFPGIDILGKPDFKDTEAFLRRIKGGTCAIVATKNGSRLDALIQNFQKGNVKGLSCLLIDDEADQASPNTKASKGDGSVSPINDKITTLRSFFEKTTYLQVTATPQALFLQAPDHAYRPKFTVLSHPGHDYVGGDDFFSANSTLVTEFDLNDISKIAPGPMPSPRLEIPKSLLQALDTFVVGATYKRMKEADQNCAFLCHVSTRKSDHNHIVNVLLKYKLDLTSLLKKRDQGVLSRLQAVYVSLKATHSDLGRVSFDKLVDDIEFLSPGIAVKLVNGETDEDVAVRSPLNLFVGGNKLGRGVTIKNLLVSYYGRNPKNPQADTVLQHARMYGYRRKDIGLLRLFLPRQLHTVFRAINKMETSLREFIGQHPGEDFRGIYVESGLSATRKNILAPGAVGVYTAGSNYNPSQVLRNATVKANTKRIDDMLAGVKDKEAVELPIAEIEKLISLTMPDASTSELVWNPIAVASSVAQLGKLLKHTKGFVYVDRDRGLNERRRETQGIITGGEQGQVPDDRIALFLLRTSGGPGQNPSWWPQIRFPNGSYAFAFAV